MPRSGKEFIFVTGGRRSGKSSYALGFGESLGKRRLYIATARLLDLEMEERIARHRSERGLEWETVEEPVNIAKTISGSSLYDVIVIDCLTLWLCNLVHESGFGDKELFREMDALADVCQDKETAIIAVSNELGFGVIPDNPLSRRFSDLAGTMNQKMAKAADRVVLTVSGVPVTIKGS